MAAAASFQDRMQLDEAASDRSSSSLSPPPTTPQHADTIHVARPQYHLPHVLGEGVANLNAGTPAQTSNAAIHAQNGNVSAQASTTANGAAPEKPRRQRRPIEPAPKKPRKPRAPKDATAAATTAPRKKQKMEEKPPPPADGPAITRQPTLTEMMHSYHQPAPPTAALHQPPSQQQPQPQPQPQHRSSLGPPPPSSTLSSSRPTTSGQNYDPIRGFDPVRAASYEGAQHRPTHPPNGVSSAQASPHVNRASASPSIASLIDPPAPVTARTSMPAPPPYSPQANMHQPPYLPSQPQSPTPPKPVPVAYPHPLMPKSPVQAASLPPPISAMDGAMDVDLTCDGPKALLDAKTISKSSSTGPTPKPKATSPPLKVAGSGLLSANDLLGGGSSSDTNERLGVNIDIHIPLNPAGGNTINIAHEIMKKYGRDAINPRAAAHREQLQRIRAAASKLEGGASADDMSLDLSEAGDDDSNAEMGGMDDDKSGTGADGKAQVRKRRKKVEEYDKEDEFIDDTELAWQEQAAVSKDGFFVYSGPLVPPGEVANVESTTTSGRGGRGRGRGGGRGSRGGATAGATHASLAEKSKEASAPTRARGRGRGTGAPRKPRITKADRERMETEKTERERAGQVHNGGPTGVPPSLAPPPPQQALPSYGGPIGGGPVGV
ncbi:HIR complex subunit [Recurvomyces mirabilis]|nr:HIR complex subunit [Recurvomyces mirabilis]